MQASSVVSLLILGGLAGFGVYCLSYAVHVWRSRNASAAAGAGPAGPRGLVRRCSAAAVAAGLLCLAGAVALGASVRRDGVLRGHGLYSPRLPEGLEVAEVTTNPVVAAGDVVARLRSAKWEADVDALKLRRRVLAAERRVVESEPLELDPEVVRREQEQSTERRHLEYSFDQYLPARDLVIRERMRDRLEKLELVRRLEADLDRLTRERDQAAAKHRLTERQVVRAEKLSPSGAASGDEFAQRKTELEFQALEVAKLERQIEAARREAAQVREDLDALDALTAGQAAELAKQVEKVGERLAALPGAEGPLKERLSADVARAEQHRAARLQRLDAELVRCDAELAGLTGSMTVVAPFAGRVAFRDPSPATVRGDAPLLVLAPPEAFRLRVRMPAAEARALARAGETTLRLLDDQVEYHFPARLADRQALPHDRGHVLAELSCEPPADAVRDLAAGKAVSARLLWVPPLYTSPLFVPGAGLAVLGIAGFAGASLSAGRSRRGASTQAARRGPPAQAPPACPEGAVTPVPTAAAAAALGATAPVLRLLGSQFRQTLLSGDYDVAVIAAVEWALDRHHARAARVLAEALGDDAELLDAVPALLRDPSDAADRILGILRAVGGERVQQRLRPARRQRTETHPAAGRRNGDGNGHHALVAAE